jgi:son of sevenless-like protein
LHDLHAVLVSLPPVIESEGRPLINFKRFMKLASSIREVLQFKVPSLAKQQNPGVIAYIETHLRSAPTDAALDALEKRSRALAEQEEKLRELRLPELRALGFATDPPPVPQGNGSSSNARRRDSALAGVAGF